MGKSIENGKLGDLYIDRDDIIATYEDGPDQTAKYEKIKTLLDKSVSMAAIMRHFPSVHPESVRSTAKNIINHDRKPQCVKGADYLKKLGLLPMGMDNSRLPLLNLLISANFWRGYRSDSKGTSNQSAISIQNPVQEKAVSQLLNEIGCEWEHSYFKKPRKDTKCHRIIYSAVVGRLVELMGYGTGRKKNNVLMVPVYIKAALLSLQAINTPQQERIIAAEILRDYILTFLFFRYHFNGHIRRARLLRMPDDSAAKKHALLTSKIANAALNPALYFGSRDQSVDDNGVLTVKTRISEQEIVDAYQKRVQEVIEQTRAACGKSTTYHS